MNCRCFHSMESSTIAHRMVWTIVWEYADVSIITSRVVWTIVWEYEHVFGVWKHLPLFPRWCEPTSPQVDRQWHVLCHASGRRWEPSFPIRCIVWFASGFMVVTKSICTAWIKWFFFNRSVVKVFSNYRYISIAAILGNMPNWRRRHWHVNLEGWCNPAACHPPPLTEIYRRPIASSTIIIAQHYVLWIILIIIIIMRTSFH